MPRHAGLSVLLSYAIVTILIVLLYRPGAVGEEPGAGPAEPVPVAAPARLPEVTPGRPWTEPPGPRPQRSAAASPGPHEPFTEAREGETLADLARRIYGDPGAAERLWEANRDQLPTRESPLRAGQPLRSP